MVRRITALIASVLTFAFSAAADITETRVEYSQGGEKLVGYLYSDSKVSGAAPGVLVFSDWLGVGQFAKDRARELAGLGYRAFVADVYGNEHVAKDTKEAGELSKKFKGDRTRMRARGAAALEALLKNGKVDPKHVAAMGFCFGGTVALELARSGADLASIVSFHGGLETPDPSLAKNIKAKILALHGADDPYVPAKEVGGFEDEMRKANVSWELVKYSNSVHSFTNPAAGNDNSAGAAYNETAARRSFERMRAFFKETLG